MNYVTKNARLIMLALASVFVSATVYSAPTGTDNKIAEKARIAVEEAAPDDWHTYAVSAEKCMKKKVNLAEAKEWLVKSLEIKETPYNLAVMGDYYTMNKLPEQALEILCEEFKSWFTAGYYLSGSDNSRENDESKEQSGTGSQIVANNFQ